MPAESPAVIIFDQDGYAVEVIQDDEGNYRLAVDAKVGSDPFSEDRDKIVGVNFHDTPSVTTYYVFVDLDGAQYKHTSGSAAIVTGLSGKALKEKVGAEWAIQLIVVLRIDGVDADLGILPTASISLQKTSSFIGETQANYFPTLLDLTVLAGDFTKISNGYKELNVSDVNTGITFSDVFGANVTPAVGDILLRVNKISGTGGVEFSYGMQYWVE